MSNPNKPGWPRDETTGTPFTNYQEKAWKFLEDYNRTLADKMRKSSGFRNYVSDLIEKDIMAYGSDPRTWPEAARAVLGISSISPIFVYLAAGAGFILLMFVLFLVLR